METQDERTSTGTRVKDWLKKTAAQRTEPKAWHNESPASRRTKAQVGRMVERGQSDKGKRGTATQTWGHARKEILRRLTRNTGHSQRGTATQPAAASATGTRGARRQSEACGGGGQSNDGSARPRKGQKKGARRVVMSKAADEQGAKVTQQWRLNGKGAQGDALPCDRWRSEGREKTTHGGCLRGRAESDHASTLPLAEGRAITFSNSGQHRETRVVLATRRSRKAVTLRAGKWAHAPPAKRGRKARHWRRVENTLTNEGGVQERKTLFRQRIGEEGGQRRGDEETAPR
ncbi:hypothetical protein ERJ75_001136200 [Trypanosoma vivax]|nr:hypothetical protein ERJ75_001136200 [Trypanosoma vivax]